MPFVPAGTEWSIAARQQPDRRTGLYAFYQRADLNGSGQATITGDSTLGNTHTNYNTKTWGFAAQHTFGGTGTLGISYAVADSFFQSQGYNFDPGPLGLSGFDLAGYFINGSLVRRYYGLQWRQKFSREHVLQFDYQWIEAPTNATYGVEGSSFLLGQTQSGSIAQPDLRGHYVRLRYSIPIRRLEMSFSISQLIPLSTAAHKPPSVPPPPPGPSTETSGGALFQWDLSVPL
jgi:hypothetical protein